MGKPGTLPLDYRPRDREPQWWPYTTAMELLAATFLVGMGCVLAIVVLVALVERLRWGDPSVNRWGLLLLPVGCAFAWGGVAQAVCTVQRLRGRPAPPGLVWITRTWRG